MYAINENIVFVSYFEIDLQSFNTVDHQQEPKAGSIVRYLNDTRQLTNLVLMITVHYK